MSISGPLQLNTAQLWQFSLACYPKVKTLCLRWQDDYNANVNVILALCYAERLAWQTNHAILTKAITKLAPLNNQVTQILRLCRRHIAGLPLTDAQQSLLKQNLLSTELIAEQVEQQLICSELAFTGVTSAENLMLYLELLNLPLTTELTADLIDLRQACSQIPLS